MNLAIDIGNSFIHLAVFRNKRMFKTFNFGTDEKSILISRLRIISKNYRIKGIGISSVVPVLNYPVKNHIRKYFKSVPLTISNKTYLPVKIKVKNSNTLGSDRICNAAFGFEENKSRSNVLIIDLGTANKYDLVLKSGEYIGGIIAPGLKVSAAALHSNTGKLPFLNIEKLSAKAPLIGKNTFEAIQSGLVNYMKAATEGIVKQVKTKYPGKLKIYLTGGSAKLIKNDLSFEFIYTENIVLRGINTILNYQNS